MVLQRRRREDAATEAAAEPVTTVTQDIESLVSQLQSVRDAAIAGLKALSKLSKRVTREVKEAGRRRRRNKAVPVEGAAPVAKRPTIFTTPVTLRDSLCVFLGKPKGSQMTPADVTKAFSTYVESHKLKAVADSWNDSIRTFSEDWSPWYQPNPNMRMSYQLSRHKDACLRHMLLVRSP